MSDQVGEVSQAYHADVAGSVVLEGYKQTEVGVIPEDWIVRDLGALGQSKNGINKGAGGRLEFCVNRHRASAVCCYTSNTLSSRPSKKMANCDNAKFQF